MGIQKLNILVKKYSSVEVTRKKITDYANTTIVVDTFGFIKKFKVNNSTNSDLCLTFIKHVSMLLKYNIVPIYIIGSFEINENYNKQKSHDGSEVQNLDVVVTENDIINIKKLLQCIGIPVLYCDSEIESMCSQLTSNNNGVATVVFSDNTNMLPYGCGKLVTNLGHTSGAILEEYDLNDILLSLNMNLQKFIDLCILLGCDYCDKLYMVGPKKALDWLEKYKTIENIIKYMTDKEKERRKVSDNYLDQVKLARVQFGYVQSNIIDDLQLKIGATDGPELITFLVSKCNCDSTKAQKIVSKINRLITSSQPKNPIFNYFGNV